VRTTSARRVAHVQRVGGFLNGLIGESEECRAERSCATGPPSATRFPGPGCAKSANGENEKSLICSCEKENTKTRSTLERICFVGYDSSGMIRRTFFSAHSLAHILRRTFFGAILRCTSRKNMADVTSTRCGNNGARSRKEQKRRQAARKMQSKNEGHGGGSARRDPDDPAAYRLLYARQES
jgi:hypothetical protein